MEYTVPRNMTEKRKRALKSLFGVSAESILQGLSSEFCDGDEKEFRSNFGISSKEMIEAIETLKYILR